MQIIRRFITPRSELSNQRSSFAAFASVRSFNGSLLLTILLTLVGGCNSSRNIDEDDRTRRLGDYSEEEWQEASGGRQQVDSFRFEKANRSGHLLRLQYHSNVWSDDWSTFSYGEQQLLYVDLERKEASTKPLRKPFQRFSTLTCLPPEEPLPPTQAAPEPCAKFSFKGSMTDFLPGTELSPRLGAIENTVTVELFPFDIDLIRFRTLPAEPETAFYATSEDVILGKLRGIKIENTLDDATTQLLYSEGPLPTGPEFNVRIELEPEGVYWFDLPVTTPAAGLLFDRCEQNHGEAVMVRCYFINPSDHSVTTTTTYGFKRNKPSSPPTPPKEAR